MSTRTSRAAKGTFTSIFQIGLRMVVQLALIPFVLKMEGQEVLGIYIIILQITTYSNLIDLGFGVALSRYLAQAFGFGNRENRFETVFSMGRTFYLGSNSAFALIVFILSFYIKDLFSLSQAISPQACLALYILSAWAIIRTPIAVYHIGLIATQNMAMANTSDMIGRAGFLLLSLVLLGIGTGVVGLILAQVLSEALTYGIEYKYFRKKYPNYHFVWGIPDMPLFKEMFRFGAQYLGVNIAVKIFYNVDDFIVGYLFGASADSIYHITQRPAFLGFQLIWKITDNAAPAANELFAQDKHTNLQRAYLKLMRYSMLLTLPLSLVIIVFNKHAISIWVGLSQYAGDIMTYSLAIFAIFEVLNHINGMIIAVSGELGWWSIVSIFSGGFNLGLSFFLGKKIGIQGVMVASVLAAIPITYYLFSRSLTITKIPLKHLWDEVFSPCLVANIPIIILVFIIKAVNIESSWLVLCCFIPLFVTCWVMGLMLIGLHSSEKKAIASFIKIKLAKMNL